MSISSSSFLAIEALSFSYESASEALFDRLQFALHSGWTGVCGPNGSGKSTLLQLIAGQLQPTEGNVRVSGKVVFCEQRTDSPPEHAAEFIGDYGALSYQIRIALDIEDEWIERWPTLSHGERKRLQVGTALWREPEVLLLDEPGNHLDHDSMQQMVRALRSFKGVGLIVTHDRSLLDDLCDQCLWFDRSGMVQMLRGGYTSGLKLREKERLEQGRTLERFEKEQKRLNRVAGEHRREANQADRKRSGRNSNPKDRDARDKRQLARVSGKDGIDGKRLRQMEGRIRQLKDQKDTIRISREFETGIWMDFEPTHRNLVFEQPEQLLSLGDAKILNLPRLELRPGHKLLLTGPNGAGKSTLLNWLVENHRLDPHELVYLPQEIPATQSKVLLAELKEIENEQLGKIMRIVRRLGSDPSRLLESELPSPGEMRKLLLAVGILNQPAFLILDEPTNHLDLPSIECLQQALMESPVGYLIVSHDPLFCDSLDAQEWRIQEVDGGYELML